VTSAVFEADVVAAAGALDGLEGADTLAGVVQVDVTDGTDGDASLHAEFEHGRLVGLVAGPGDAPDTTVSLSVADARAVVDGALQLSVAFMQGRLKVAGDMGIVLDLLALSATPDARGRLSRIAGITAD